MFCRVILLIVNINCFKNKYEKLLLANKKTYQVSLKEKCPREDKVNLP